MRFSLVTLTASAALLSPVLANFDLYMVQETIATDLGVSESKVWQVFEAEPTSCDQVMNQRVWSTSNDVSGTKTGVRCVGDGCDYRASIDNIDVLEMNFHGGDTNVLHWTLYKDRGRTMVGLDGNTYGNCIPFPNGDYSCRSGVYFFREGFRKFRCLTRFTANDLNNS